MRTWILWGAILGAAAGCGDEKAKDDYLKKAKKSEAELELMRISKSAKAYYAEKAEFPRGNQPMTPSAPCCAKGGQTKCPAGSPEWQASEIWNQLDFEMTESHYFRYSYESDGQTFVARAAADLDCDGTEGIWEMRGQAVNGAPTVELVKPARAE